LVATAGSLDRHADLLLKRGVTAVRGGTSHAGGPAWPRWLGGRTPQAAANEPRSIRYGLWEFRPDVTLPAAGRGARRRIELASESGTTCQVSVDAAALAAEGRSGAAALDALLLAVDNRRAEGTLAVGTLADAARRLLRPRTLTAAQSILRTRAA